MKRWKMMFLGLALAFAAMTGCTQQLYITHDTLNDFTKRMSLPTDLLNPVYGTLPHTTDSPSPSDISNPERDPRYMTLNEAMALALENGVVGLRSIRSLGIDDLDLLGDSQGSFTPRTDSIKILSLEPAVFGTNIETQLARYDVTFRSLAQFSTSDPNQLAPGRFQAGQFAQLGASFEKLLPGGGFAMVDFGSPTSSNSPGGNFYNNFTNISFLSGAVNPNYQPDLHFVFNQPLLQGFGAEYNELTPIHPFSSQNQSFGVGGTSAFQGILVARLRFDQTRAELERNVSFLLLNVETAYWNLYGSFVNLYSSEQAMRQAYEAWRISKAKYEAGSIAITQFAQTRGQYEQFRGDRITALGQVLESERILRHLIGLPVEDGKRLVPVDTPTLTPYVPDWHSAVNEALNLRPELVLARTELKNRQLEVIRVKNQLLPTLNLLSNYNLHGFGTRLDGDGVLVNPTTNAPLTSNAFESLAGLHNADFSVGLQYSMPLGFRFANAQVRQAHLRVAQGYQELKDQEIRAVNFVEQQLRTIVEKYSVIQARRAQRVAFGEQVEARFKEFVAGKTTADFLLEAQRQWAAALSTEYQEVVNYNNALARFQFAKGTLLQHDSIIISDGDLPQCAQVKAVETERKRSKALVIRERISPVPVPTNAAAQNCSPLPKLPTSAPSVPDLVSGAPPVPEEMMRSDALFTTEEKAGPLEVREVSSMGIRDTEIRSAAQPATTEPVTTQPPMVPVGTPELPTIPSLSSMDLPTAPRPTN